MLCFNYFEASNNFCLIVSLIFGCLISICGFLFAVLLYRTLRQRRDSVDQLGNFDFMDNIQNTKTKTSEVSNVIDFSFQGISNMPIASNKTPPTEIDVICKGDSKYFEDLRKNSQNFLANEISHAKLSVENTLIDNAEKKISPLGTNLPLLIPEPRGNILHNSFSYENIKFYRSHSIKSGVILYDTKSQHFLVYKSNILTVAVHVIPPGPENEVFQSHKMSICEVSSTLENASSLTEESQLKSKVENSLILKDQSSIKIGSKHSNINNDNQFSIRDKTYGRVSKVSFDKLYNYVPQFIITNCIKSLLKFK